MLTKDVCCDTFVHFQICNLFVNDLCRNTKYRLPWRTRSFLVVIASIHESAQKVGKSDAASDKDHRKIRGKSDTSFFSLSYRENIALKNYLKRDK